MAKHRLTKQQLEEHLAEQIAFLKASADSFDNGFLGEAKRMAVSLRVLLHQTPKSHSLLGQLGIRQQPFVDSSYDYDPENLVATHGLISLQFSENEIRYSAPLDGRTPMNQRLIFSKWWEKIVLAEPKGRSITRRQLVLSACNQDGGAHVDPELDQTYHDLKQNNLLGWMVNDKLGEHALKGAEAYSLRQIAHEVLKTLDPLYTKSPAS